MSAGQSTSRRQTTSWAAQARRSEWKLAALAAGVAAVALAVLVPAALRRPLWQDEVASARVILQPTLSDALARVKRTESTPPGWYVLTWLGHRAGISILALRFLSVLCGAALAALTAFGASRLMPRPAAVAVGLLLIFGWQFAFHGTELRAYALLALLALLFALSLEQAARMPTRRQLGLLAACVGLGALTHYFFLLTVAAGLIWIWTEPGLHQARRRLTAAIGAGLVLLLPWLPALVTQLGNGRFGWIGGFDSLKVAYSYSALVVRDRSLYASGIRAGRGAGQLAPRLAILLLVLAGLIVLWRRSPRGRLWALLAIAPIGLAALLWMAGLRVFDARNLVEVGPFAAAAALAALAALPRLAATAAIAASVGLAAAGFALAPPSTPPYDRVAEALDAEGWRPHDPVLLVPEGPALRTPITWYLSEDLSSRATKTPPAYDYLVAERWRWRQLRPLLSDISSRKRVGPFVVARLQPGALGAERGD